MALSKNNNDCPRRATSRMWAEDISGLLNQDSEHRGLLYAEWCGCQIVPRTDTVDAHSIYLPS
jgi:hypothetical protein